MFHKNWPRTPSFPVGLVKTESESLDHLEPTLGDEHWYVVNVSGYRFMTFLDLTCHLEDAGIGTFWLHCGTW